MSDFFMGQIMMTGFGYAQKYFAACDGAMVPIAQNQALFTLLGVTFGGNGIQTFGLPDLRGRTPAGAVQSQNANWQPVPYLWGTIGGTEQVALTPDQNGPHTHAMTATTAAATDPALNGDPRRAQASSGATSYGPPSATPLPLAGGPTSIAGSGAPHTNMQPYQVINFNIAMVGIYPSRS